MTKEEIDVMMCARKQKHLKRKAELVKAYDGLIAERKEKRIALDEEYAAKLEKARNNIHDEQLQYNAAQSALADMFYAQREHTPEEIARRWAFKVQRGLDKLKDELAEKIAIDTDGVRNQFAVYENGVRFDIFIPLKR